MLSSTQRQMSEQVEYCETEQVKASMLPPRKLKAKQSAWQEPQLCDAIKKILTIQSISLCWQQTIFLYDIQNPCVFVPNVQNKLVTNIVGLLVW